MMKAAILYLGLSSSFQNVEFLKNYDGDTFSVHIKNMPEVFGYDIPVRIKGIDTPEIKSEIFCERFDAIEARDALFKVLDGKRIDLECERDKYFRLLCSVMVSGFLDVRDYMLSHGYAAPYDGKTKPKWICKRVMP